MLDPSAARRRRRSLVVGDRPSRLLPEPGRHGRPGRLLPGPVGRRRPGRARRPDHQARGARPPTNGPLPSSTAATTCRRGSGAPSREDPLDATQRAGTRQRLCRVMRDARPAARSSCARHGADAQDLFLEGWFATVTGVFTDFDGEVHLAVTVEDDPGADMHAWYGRYRYVQAARGRGGLVIRVLIAGVGKVRLRIGIGLSDRCCGAGAGGSRPSTRRRSSPPWSALEAECPACSSLAASERRWRRPWACRRP